LIFSFPFFLQPWREKFKKNWTLKHWKCIKTFFSSTLSFKPETLKVIQLGGASRVEMLNARANLSVCQNVQWTFECAYKGPIKKGRDKLTDGDRKMDRRS
jgi:hypothetical protein